MLRLVKTPHPVDDPDTDLIPALMRGDEAALGQLMDRHIHAINSLATRMLGDPFMAEDVTQSVFLKTWQMMPQWEKGKAKLITWMRRVATNLCLDMLRKKQPVFTDTPPDVVDLAKAQDRSLEEADNRNMITEGLNQLPDRQRLALVLSYYEHVSQKEGAEIMEISVSAFESLLSRARRSLKSIIEAAHTDIIQEGVKL